MPETGQRLRAALDGYAKFFRDMELTLPKRQPYLVRWVRQFLHFATYVDSRAVLSASARRKGLPPSGLFLGCLGSSFPLPTCLQSGPAGPTGRLP